MHLSNESKSFTFHNLMLVIASHFTWLVQNTLCRTQSGLPEDESKITQLLFPVSPGWAQHGADSEGDGAVLRATQPCPDASKPQTTVYLHQKPRTVVTAVPTSSGFNLHLYDRTHWATIPSKAQWLAKIWKCIIHIYVLFHKKGFKWVGSTVRYSHWQFAQNNLALGRPPFQQQFLRDVGLEVRVKKFAGMTAGRE